MASEYEHTIGALAVLRWLTEMGFETSGFCAEFADEGDLRTADIRLISPSGDFEMLEVKTDRQLIWPRALSLPNACRIVESRLRKAGSSSKGQLRAGDYPALVIVGFGLTDQQMATMLRAFASQRSRWKRTRDHVRMIGVLTLQVRSTPFRRQWDGRGVTTLWESSVSTRVRFAINPGVEGETFLERSGMKLEELRLPLPEESRISGEGEALVAPPSPLPNT
jgi:hypothetical protein